MYEYVGAVKLVVPNQNIKMLFTHARLSEKQRISIYFTFLFLTIIKKKKEVMFIQSVQNYN